MTSAGVQPDALAAMVMALVQSESVTAIPQLESPETSITAMHLLNTYAPVFVIAFVVTLILTPIVRRIAISAHVVDHPDESRKTHRAPVAYLGGLAVFFGVLAATSASFFLAPNAAAMYLPLPMAIIIGMVAITLTGFADDVWGWDPRLKIAGQLVAAAALAIERTGVEVAEGLLQPLMGRPDDVLFSIGALELTNDPVFYWVGTAIIAIFVLGGCNAANLIDGLDGLLSGIVAIVAVGLLAICLMVAVVGSTGPFSLDGARIVLCLALLGAVLGFLPHNFNPATIFLGDCGSLLLGYLCVVIILMLGDQGQTHLVLAGLIVFGVPIADTVLAIIRRRLTGRSMSAADDQHMHHVLLRATGGVKRAVFSMYGFGALFAALGVGAAAIVLFTEARVRMLYAVAIVVFGFIGALGLKSARQQQARMSAESMPKAEAGSTVEAPARGERTGPSTSTDELKGGVTRPSSP